VQPGRVAARAPRLLPGRPTGPGASVACGCVERAVGAAQQIFIGEGVVRHQRHAEVGGDFAVDRGDADGGDRPHGRSGH
jgi:hypothetical protein